MSRTVEQLPRFWAGCKLSARQVRTVSRQGNGFVDLRFGAQLKLCAGTVAAATVLHFDVQGTWLLIFTLSLLACRYSLPETMLFLHGHE